jgi:hypothetical protein
VNSHQRRILRRQAERALADVRPDIEVTDALAQVLLVQLRRTMWEKRGGRLFSFKSQHPEGLSRRGRQVLAAVRRHHERERELK